MQKIKDLTIFKFLSANDLKSRAIKLAIALFFMCLGYVNSVFVYIAFSLCTIYLLCEFSMDSIFWVCFMSMSVRAEDFLAYAIMWVMIAILIVKLILDIKNKKINYKNWRFITISILFAIFTIILLLPFCKVYKFTDQFGPFTLFILAVLGLLYVKEINFKNLFILIPIVCAILCISYYLFSIFGIVDFICYSESSFGSLGRFDPIYADPNFTGAVLIGAISCWFVAYKKKFIKKLPYFIVLTILFVFSIMTISKAALLILALFAVFVLVDNIITTIKTKNPKNLLELVYYGIALIVTCLICYQYVDALYQRLFNPNKGWWSEGDETGLATLTTGRTDLWKAYLRGIFSSAQTILFGFGGASQLISNGAAHSTPIDYVFRYGLIPTLILVAIFVVAAIPYLKKVKLYNFVPVVLLTAIFCSLGSTNAKYIWVFVISFMALCCNGIENKNKTNNTEQKQENEIIQESAKE